MLVAKWYKLGTTRIHMRRRLVQEAVYLPEHLTYYHQLSVYRVSLHGGTRGPDRLSTHIDGVLAKFKL